MTKPILLTVLSSLLAAGVIAVGCGDPKPANTGDDVTASTNTTADMPPTTDTATAPPTATTPPAPKYKGPGPTSNPYGPGNPKAFKAGTKLATAAKPEDDALLRPKLDAAVEANGEGFAFEGSPAAGRLKQGDALEITFTLAPNKCYSVIAVSADGITELDVNVLGKPPTPLPIPVALPPVATDTSKGPDSIVGAGTGCFKSPVQMAVEATVQVKATKGAGAAAVQVLSK